MLHAVPALASLWATDAAAIAARAAVTASLIVVVVFIAGILWLSRGSGNKRP